jgi:hypothetical protein
MKLLTRSLNTAGCSAKHRCEASSMVASWEPAIRRCIWAMCPGVHSSYRPSQVFSVPVTVNSLGPFMKL